MALFKLTKQDRDYYALQDLLKPKEDQQEETAGIGTKPGKQEQDEEGRFLSFFGGLFDRSQQQAEELAKLAQEEAERSALEARLMREASGITKSLTEEDVAIRSATRDPRYGNQMPEETTLVDVTDTDMGKLTNVKPLYDLAEAVDTGTIDTSELPGKGLMSPRLDDRGETPSYNPDVITKEGRAGLKEAQKVLSDLGYYKSSIDGVTGANTSNAIKVYQYDNGLEVTGELDSATKKKLSEGGTSVPKPENELLASISEHEGGYGAANNGTSRLAKKFSVSGTYYSDNYNKPLTEMTVNEILNAQNGTTGKTDAELLELDPETRAAQRNREFFAVGAYQIIPITMKKALQEGAISGDEVFSPELQDRIALQFLAGSDKPKLRAYIRGEEGASLDDAAMALAEQWASFPVPRDVRNNEGQVIAATGRSRYGSGNRALHDLTSTKNMLKSVRKAFTEQVQTAVP